MMAKNRMLCIIAVAISLIAVLAIVLAAFQGAPEPVNSFEDCARAGNPIMESHPPQCRTPDGRTFVGPQSP